ncbi:MAG: papain-like cysteine protease family protein [Bacteroidia bacterium]|nr:papain-like cysteine protease family protein [Bacteroidia bacterium]
MKRQLVSWLMLTVLAVTTQAQSIQQLGPNYFAAGVPSNEFEYYAAAQTGGRQRSENWCWAACIQMVLNYHGVQVSQEQIVARIYGGLTDQPGTLDQMQQALSGWAPNVNGRYSMIYSQAGFTSVNEITQNLAYKWPIIVGLRSPGSGIGHAYVLTAIYYSLDMYGNTVPDKVVLRDPWPQSPSRQEMSWYEFSQRLDIGLKVWITR